MSRVNTNSHETRRRQLQKRRKAKNGIQIFLVLTVLMLLGVFLINNIIISEKGTQPFDFKFSNENLDKLSDTEHVSDDWNLLLVNWLNHLPDDYAMKLTQLSNGESVDERIYPDLQKMFDAARAEGIYPIVRSGYRTSEMQQDIMDDKIKEYQEQGYSYLRALLVAKAWVAAPGTSEHQSGLAVDINADIESSTNEELYEWLYSNSYKYGFILRYPPDKMHLTGVSHEPWHYRYVGKDAAEEIYKQAICLEEYLANIEHKQA